MTGIESAVTGTVTQDVVARVSAKGKPYATINLKIGDGEDAMFCNVLVFDLEVIEAAKGGRITRGTQLYAEGKLQIGQWVGDDGRSRMELKMMARYCRPSEIGRNRPKKPKKAKSATSSSTTSGTTTSIILQEASEPTFDDPIPF